jgi:hypothetical protein
VDCVSGLLLDSNRERVFWKNDEEAAEGDDTGVLARLEGDGNVGGRGIREGGGVGVCSVGNKVREGDEECRDRVAEMGESKGRGESLGRLSEKGDARDVSSAG